MIRISSRSFAAIFLAACALRAVGADAVAPVESAGAGTEATVVGDRVNIRGLASMTGEVITQINMGEKVVILEEIKGSKAQKGAPALWAKILLPTNTPVWVHADFIDEASKTVKPRKLNVRSGPGERFSAIGVLNKGAEVKELRRVDSWIEIEPPAGTFGFVAANFLKKGAPADAIPVIAAETKPATTNMVATVPAEAAAATHAPTASASATNTPTVTTETVAVPEAPAPAAPMTNAPVVLGESAAQPDPVPSPVVVAPGENPPTEPPLVPRVVIRDGWVRRTLSIQAPTAYGLENSQNGRLMNYLMSTNDSLNLRDLRGFKVMVKGEEYLDKRWPNTPIIKIQTIEFAP
jgi:uncharacterized protein YraI